MRVLALAIVAAFAVGTPLQAQPVKWAEMVTLTPRGGVLMGNPKAAVTIVEFGSFSCSHCATFHKTGLPALKAKYLAGGRVSYEFRSFVRNGPDYSASLIAACLPAAAQLKLMDQLFDRQAVWLTPYMSVSQADMAAAAALPMDRQFVQMAALGKLDDWAAGQGVPVAMARTCLTDKVRIERIADNRLEAVEIFKLEGTPTFVMNGKTVSDSFDWATLEPALVAALK